MGQTVQPSIVRLDMRLLDSAIFDDKGITLRAVTAEDGRAVESEIKTLGEGQARVCQEANLRRSVCRNSTE